MQTNYCELKVNTKKKSYRPETKTVASDSSVDVGKAVVTNSSPDIVM